LSGWALLALHCARPGAAWALLLPVAFLLALRAFARPPEVVVGTLELWQGVASPSPSGRAAVRIPPWALLVVLALSLGALAWMGPRGPRAGTVRTWTCVVDRSPSMGLADGAERTRLDAALASAEGWLARECGPGDRVRWLAAGRAPRELPCGERPEPAWLAPERGQGGEPEWGLHDRPGALWITDREPAVPRAHAGLFASGGAAVAGPVAADGRTTWTWDGEALSARASPRPLAVRVSEPAGLALPAVLERMLVAWCEARGLELARQTEHETLLLVELGGGDGGGEDLVLERDGWRASGRGALPELDPGPEGGTEGEAWLAALDSAGSTLPLVRWSPGRIDVGLRALAEPAGDPALFALSWAQLFERAALRPAGVVPLAERRAAGAPLQVPGAPAPQQEDERTDPGPTLDALLALGALLAALLAGSLRVRVLVGEHAVRGQARVAATSHH
jgi:hypothetical protein